MLACMLGFSAACSALFGSDFDGYSERHHASGAGGRDASVAPTAGSGGRTTVNDTGGSANPTASGGDASIGGATPVPPDHVAPDVEPREVGSGPDRSIGPEGGTGGGVGVRSPEGGRDVDADEGVEPPFVPPPPRPPYGSPWPLDIGPDNIGPFHVAGIEICYTIHPHVEWNGAVACYAQVDATRSCSGDQFDGTTVADVRLAFESLLEDAWARVANVEFYSADCVSDDTHHIGAANGPIMAVTFTTEGKDAAPLTNAVTGIGLHYGPGNSFAPDLHVDWKGLMSRDPDALRKILRESGQILGLPYEGLRGTPQQETAAPKACPTGLVRESPPSWSLTSLVDFYSVMDRCTPTSLITRPGLSPGDVASIQKLYGTKPTGALIGYRGGCTGPATSADGATVTSFPCRFVDLQTWSRPASATWPAFELTSGSDHWCMSVSGNAVGTGFTPVLGETCTQTDGQYFETKNVQWRAMGNMCVGVDGGHFGVPALAFCSGKPAQQWSFFDVNPSTTPTWDMIQYVPTGECVTMQTQSGALGEVATMATCSPADIRQHFRFDGGGLIRYGNYCLNVLGGQILDGELIGTTGSCGTNPPAFSSVFSISGNMKALGQCLSMEPLAGHIGKLGVEPCAAGNPNEMWDFHF